MEIWSAGRCVKVQIIPSFPSPALQWNQLDWQAQLMWRILFVIDWFLLVHYVAGEAIRGSYSARRSELRYSSVITAEQNKSSELSTLRETVMETESSAARLWRKDSLHVCGTSGDNYSNCPNCRWFKDRQVQIWTFITKNTKSIYIHVWLTVAWPTTSISSKLHTAALL